MMRLHRTVVVFDPVQQPVDLGAADAGVRIPTIPARDSNLKAATIPIEGGQYWPVGMFMGSQRW